MKLYQLISHETGARSPVLYSPSLLAVAQQAQAISDEANQPEMLEDLILVLVDEIDGQVYPSQQPLMKLRTVLELHARGVTEPSDEVIKNLRATEYK